MDFDQLQALLWVHEHGSFQRAARASGVSRATLRRRLERLDAAVGRPTHVAGPDGIRLTAAGHALVADGRELLASRARLLERARGARTTNDTLRVLVQNGLPPRAMALCAEMLEAALPGVRFAVDFDAEPSRRLDEPFDAVVHWRDAPVSRSGFTRTLVRVPCGVMAAPGYLAAHGRPETPADLAAHRLLHLEGTAPRWPLVDGSFLEITPTHSCSDLYMLGLMAGRGLGLALVPIQGPGAGAPESLVAPEIESLVQVLVDDIRMDRRVRLDMPVPAHPDSAAAALIRAVEQFVPDGG